MTTDRLGIRHTGTADGQIGVSGLSVSYGGVEIGTFSGTTSLVVVLNDKATPVYSCYFALKGSRRRAMRRSVTVTAAPASRSLMATASTR